MELKERIESFVKLGESLGQFINALHTNDNDTFYAELKKIITKATESNPWFTEKNILYALTAISNNLTYKNLSEWLSKYPNISAKESPKRIGVIMAGNIPLVGFHDFICVLISGNILAIKPSSKDDNLIKILTNLLIKINPGFNELIIFKNTLNACDAYIATGSNNTSRYFEYYFSKYPHIIRKNRNSVAILTGNESDKQLQLLANDIFPYFGLGCRNVSKIFIPRNFDFKILQGAFIQYWDIIEHKKYANNYYYNKSIFLIKNSPFYDGTFFLLQENLRFSSPISVIYYEHYTDNNSIKEYLYVNKNELQCIVSNNSIIPTALNFGEVQKPQLWDYADNVDTMEFLLNLHNL